MFSCFPLGISGLPPDGCRNTKRFIHDLDRTFALLIVYAAEKDPKAHKLLIKYAMEAHKYNQYYLVVNDFWNLLDKY